MAKTKLYYQCNDQLQILSYVALSYPDNKILSKELQLFCMTFIKPETGWFEISEVPIIDQSLAIISRIFNKLWI